MTLEHSDFFDGVSEEGDASQLSDGLWQRVLDDDHSAFEIVVDRYKNLIASVAYSSTGSFSLSEEVTQETFWQAWRQRFQLRDHARIASWLCGIARNLAHQASRTENRYASLSQIDSIDPAAVDRCSTDRASVAIANDPAEVSISEEERRLVWDALEEIPTTYREALILFYREGHSMLEVALALDVSKETAKQRVHRGRDMLRETLAQRVEDVLVRSRPTRSLTTRVMVGLAALSASLKATASVSAASAGGVSLTGLAKAATTQAASGIATSTVKSAVATGASTGIIGGLLGAVGGLGGAFLGSWVPSQMAATMAERKLLEKHGKRSFALAVVFTLVMLLITPLFFFPSSRYWAFGIMAVSIFAFVACIIAFSLRATAEIKQLKTRLGPDAEPNQSTLREYFRLHQVTYRGARFTSRWKVLGLPVIDVQFGDLIGSATRSIDGPPHAFGWIAIGDRATGILFAAGGIARGLVAIGGLAVGGIALGGGAVGGLAIGGGALGALAMGGLAVGYESVGGLAIAWHVATGGGAIARYLAVGGGAWAQEFAVGGEAVANQANTELARELANGLSKMWILDWLARNRTLFIVMTLVISICPTLLLRFAYRKCDKEMDSNARVAGS